VAGEIAPLYRGRGIGAMRKKPKRAQKKGNGLSPSVTLTHYPLNAYEKISDSPTRVIIAKS
jgi:hypothetical protein